MKLTFYYVRHGETLFNEIRRMQGKCDSPLTDEGIRQARDTASALRNVHFDRAFSSSSERAWDTAEIVCQPHGLVPQLMKELKEFDFGSLDGNPIESFYDRIQPHRMADDWTDVGGENVELFRKRAQAGFDQIVSECHDGETVLIVSHGSYFMHMMKTLLNYDQQEYIDRMHAQQRPFIPNAGIAVFTYEDGKYTLRMEPQTADEFRHSTKKNITLYFARHGETVFNVEKRVQGWCDSPLTEEGIRQAQNTGRILQAIPFAHCWCSSAERTRDTAKYMLEGRDVPLTMARDLREVYYGTYEGKHIHEIDDQRAEMFMRGEWSSVGGETKKQVHARIRQMLNQIYDTSKDGDNVLIVSHGDLYMTMLEFLFGITHHELFARAAEKGKHPAPNAGYAVIRCESGKYTLLRKMDEE